MDNKINNPEECYSRSENKQDIHVFTICCSTFRNYTNIRHIDILHRSASFNKNQMSCDVFFFCSFMHVEDFLGKINYQEFDILPSSVHCLFYLSLPELKNNLLHCVSFQVNLFLPVHVTLPSTPARHEVEYYSQRDG